MDDATTIVSILALVFILYFVVEGFAVHLDRRAHPKGDAQRLRYKPIWQFVGLLGWNLPLVTALLLGGVWAAFVVAFLLLACYAIFRYRLGRCSAMQRRFLRLPLPVDES